MYNFNSDELTWYVFGKERIAKFKHQYEEVLQKVTNDVSSIPLGGMNGDLINALSPLHEYNQAIQASEFELPNTLLLINLTNSNTLTYILESQIDIITEPYTQVASYNITEETNQFAFTMADGSIGYFSLKELFDMLGTVANNITLSPSIDPFTIPLNTAQTVHEPDFHYYIYDHLGNTRIVYSTTIPDCSQSAHYTLEAVMDYFPYGKVLREFIKTPEKYVTTHHQRDKETGLDYRGARFYDSDVARFLSLDPAAAEYPSLSDYCYVGNNPIAFIDPDGKRIVPFMKKCKSGSAGCRYGKTGIYMSAKMAWMVSDVLHGTGSHFSTNPQRRVDGEKARKYISDAAIKGNYDLQFRGVIPKKGNGRRGALQPIRKGSKNRSIILYEGNADKNTVFEELFHNAQADYYLKMNGNAEFERQGAAKQVSGLFMDVEAKALRGYLGYDMNLSSGKQEQFLKLATPYFDLLAAGKTIGSDSDELKKFNEALTLLKNELYKNTAHKQKNYGRLNENIEADDLELFHKIIQE